MDQFIRYVEKQIRPMLVNRIYSGDDELYLSLLLRLAAVFCGLAHLFLMIVFFLSQDVSLALLNIGSILVYLLCFGLIRKGHYTISGVLISMEVILYSLITSYFLGSGVYIPFYYCLILVVQAIIPYGPLSLRGGMLLLIWVCMQVTVFSPAFQDGKMPLLLHQSVLMFINIQFLFLGSVLALSAGNIVRDVITAFHREQMDILEEDVHTDPLTGLYNRRYALRLFQRLPSEGWRPYCVASVDIDDFKLVNDAYGHSVGDEVLKALAQLMKSHLRHSDVVFRWGGEEFLILLADCDLTDALTLLEKLRGEIENMSLPIHNTQISVTVTIGVADLDPLCIQESIDTSDQRLYQGKTHGKNRVVSQ